MRVQQKASRSCSAGTLLGSCEFAHLRMTWQAVSQADFSRRESRIWIQYLPVMFI